MGKLNIGQKDQLKAVKQPIRPATEPLQAPMAIQSPVVQNAIAPVIERHIEYVDRPVEVVREVIVEVPVYKEIIVERKEEVPVFKEIIKEVRVEVPVVREVVREVEKIVRIPVIERVKHVPAWVGILFWFEIVKYAGIAIWLAVK